MSKNFKEIETDVKEVVMELFGCLPSEVKTKTNFVKDLGADSLDVVEFVMAIEEKFGIEIEDEQAEKLFTVEDVVNFVKTKIK